MSQLEDSKTSFNIEVVDYIVQGDVNFYNNHSFVIRVWIGQQMYNITRSYLSFCELDAKLRRQYARSNLPVLNLAGAASNNRKIGNKIASTIKQKNAPDVRASILFADPEVKLDKKDLVRKVDNNEIIAYKKTTLHTYLHDLMKIPEILQSDILLYFVDEESISGEIVPDLTDEIQDKLEINMLLGEDAMTTKTVRKDLKIDFNVDAEDVLLWNFSTKFYDIGFSVQFNGVEVVTYQRYQCHEKAISGYFEATSKGKLTLSWDNTYSKMRSKILSYVGKVVGKVEFDTAVTSAMDLRKESLRMTKQRQNLKRILTNLSCELLSHIGLGRSKRVVEDINHQIYDENGDVIDHSTVGSFDSNAQSRTDEDSNALIVQLKNEKKFLQQALSESESALVSERTAAAEMFQQAEDAAHARNEMEEEMQHLRSELDYYRQEFVDKENSALQTMREQEVLVKELSLVEILALPVGFADSVNICSYFEIVREYATSAMKTLSENSKQIETLENQNVKLKAEKKQLKAYAIQLKSENEELTKSVEQKGHDNTLITYENQLLRQKIEMLEEQLRIAHPVRFVENQSENHFQGDDNEGIAVNNQSVNVGVVNSNNNNTMKQYFQDDEDEDSKSLSGSTSNSNFAQSNNNNSSSNLIKIDLASPPPDELHTLVASMKSSMFESMGGLWNSVVGQDTASEDSNYSNNSSNNDYSDIYSRRGSVQPTKPKMNFGF